MDYIITDTSDIIKYHPSKVYEIIKNMALINENLTYCNNEKIQLSSFVAIFFM